ncbi:MAG TPA: HIT family protein [Candidatus Saccharimonadia bacterium]
MLVEGCDTCRLLKTGGAEVIFQTEHWRVVLAPDQGYLGRAYVTLLDHRGSLPELTISQIVDWHDVVIRYEGLVSEAFEADVFNWGCLLNNAFQAADPRPHVHWHVRPRYSRTPSVDGVEYPDPQFGYHYDRRHQRVVTAEALVSIGDMLREYL